MKNKTVLNWTQELISKDGKYTAGSAVSVVSAVSASLAGFIFNLQLGKDKFVKKEDQIKENIKKASILNQEFLDLSEIDADAFSPVIPLYQLPQDTEEEKRIRKEKINQGLIDASKPPFKMLLKLNETLDLYQELLGMNLKGTIIEDITIGLEIALASIKSAKMSSMINIKGITNKELKERESERVEEKYQEIVKKAKKLLKKSRE